MDNPYWHPEQKNHFVSTEDIRLLTFDIFNIVRASMSMTGQGIEPDEVEDRDPTALELIHYQYAEIELSSKLLQLAVLMRTLDDFWSDYEHEDYVKLVEKINKEGGFGTITTEEKDLTFRDACNKIIHAADVRPVYESDDDRNDEKIRWGMDSRLELEGTFQKKKWGATINMFEFLEAAIAILEFADDHAN